MGIRESLNKLPKWAVGLLAVVILLASGMIFVQSSERGVAPNSGEPRAWYTIDDGQTWFADDAHRVVPFEHEGKLAYRAFVWTCDEGKTQFVSHLERFKPAVVKTLAGKTRIEPWDRMPGTEEVKPPLTGDRGWVDSDSPRAVQVQTPRCPSGGQPKPVLP